MLNPAVYHSTTGPPKVALLLNVQLLFSEAFIKCFAH